MQSPVDIAAFRNAIGHDADAERMLLRLFIETVDAAVEKLHTSTDIAVWEAEFHLIKGAALNVGAARLAEIAIAAHAVKEASEDEKKKALAELSSCYVAVRNYLAPLSG